MANTTPIPIPPPVPTIAGAVSRPFGTSSVYSQLSSTTFLPVSNATPTPGPHIGFMPVYGFISTFTGLDT